MTTSRSKDIIFLLGAGASAEAGIPISMAMIDLLESSLKPGKEREQYHGLYQHVKSAIHFAAGLKGHFGGAVPFNIETLINTLYELERNEEHPLYPFIAAWSSRFVALAGAKDFDVVRRFRKDILVDLKRWMCPEDSSKADYYRRLILLQRELNYPLHVFSLNYDLCVENLSSAEFRVETGFANYGPSHSWDWERFDMETTNNIAPQLVLYKLHGSINWKRKPETKELFCVAQTESVDADKMEVIFGREFKLEAADPYLFLAYKFRELSLLTKLIVTLGYGFGDAHINKMLTQSLRADVERRLLVIQRCEEKDCTEKAREICAVLELGADRKDQVIVQPGTVKECLDDPKLKERLVALIPASPDVPF
jgi:hypothetical protein